MGSEAANVHLGTKCQVKNILKHLRRMKPDWLRSAAKNMSKALGKTGSTTRNLRKAPSLYGVVGGALRLGWVSRRWVARIGSSTGCIRT